MYRASNPPGFLGESMSAFASSPILFRIFSSIQQERGLARGHLHEEWNCFSGFFLSYLISAQVCNGRIIISRILDSRIGIDS